MSSILVHDDDDKFSFASSSFRASHTKPGSSYYGSAGIDFDSENGEGSSLTEAVLVKNDFKAKFSAAQQTKDKYYKKKDQLTTKIEDMNRSGDVSLRLLDEKKDQLTKENDRLNEILDSLPTVEFLQEQAKLLTQILDVTVVSTHKSSFLDAIKLQEMGVIGPGESLAILQHRLKSIVDKLNNLLMARKKKGEITDQSYEAYDLRRKIQILKKTSPESHDLARDQCDRLENEVFKLHEDVQKLRINQNKYDSVPIITLKDLQKEAEIAGGEIDKLHCLRGNLYKYNSTLFNVEYRFNKIYAISKDTELPFVTFVKTLITTRTPRSVKRKNTLR